MELEGIGEPCAFIEPKLMGGRLPWLMGPPLGVWPLAPEALMKTEALRLCSWPAALPLGVDVLAGCGAPCAML